MLWIKLKFQFFFTVISNFLLKIKNYFINLQTLPADEAFVVISKLIFNVIFKPIFIINNFIIKIKIIFWDSLIADLSYMYTNVLIKLINYLIWHSSIFRSNCVTIYNVLLYIILRSLYKLLMLAKFYLKHCKSFFYIWIFLNRVKKNLSLKSLKHIIFCIYKNNYFNSNDFKVSYCCIIALIVTLNISACVIINTAVNDEYYIYDNFNFLDLTYDIYNNLSMWVYLALYSLVLAICSTYNYLLEASFIVGAIDLISIIFSHSFYETLYKPVNYLINLIDLNNNINYYLYYGFLEVFEVSIIIIYYCFYYFIAYVYDFRWIISFLECSNTLISAVFNTQFIHDDSTGLWWYFAWPILLLVSLANSILLFILNTLYLMYIIVYVYLTLLYWILYIIISSISLTIDSYLLDFSNNYDIYKNTYKYTYIFWFTIPTTIIYILFLIPAHIALNATMHLLSVDLTTIYYYQPVFLTFINTLWNYPLLLVYSYQDPLRIVLYVTEFVYLWVLSFMDDIFTGLNYFFEYVILDNSYLYFSHYTWYDWYSFCCVCDFLIDDYLNDFNTFISMDIITLFTLVFIVLMVNMLSTDIYIYKILYLFMHLVYIYIFITYLGYSQFVGFLLLVEIPAICFTFILILQFNFLFIKNISKQYNILYYLILICTFNLFFLHNFNYSMYYLNYSKFTLSNINNNDLFGLYTLLFVKANIHVFLLCIFFLLFTICLVYFFINYDKTYISSNLTGAIRFLSKYSSLVFNDSFDVAKSFKNKILNFFKQNK